MLDVRQLIGREYRFYWPPEDHEAVVRIHLPNLQKLQASVWGDWGPMYLFELGTNDRISVSYDGEARSLSQNKLRVESPSHVEERSDCPFYVVIEDDFDGLEFHLYVDTLGELTKVVVVSLEDQSKILDQFYVKDPRKINKRGYRFGLQRSVRGL